MIAPYACSVVDRFCKQMYPGGMFCIETPENSTFAYGSSTRAMSMFSSKMVWAKAADAVEE